MTTAGLPLNEGSIYASGSWSVGLNCFGEIDPSTLRVCDQGVDVLEWPTVAVTPGGQACEIENRWPEG